MQTWMLTAILVFGFSAAAGAAEGAVVGDLAQRMATLVVQLGILLLATKAGSLCFRRLRLPEMLGELAAGSLIGPYLLGALPLPGFPGGLFAAAVDFPVHPELYGVCALASVVLLFMMGLETDLRMFLRYSVAGTMVGLGGVLAAFVLGDLAGVLFGSAVFGRPLGFMDAPCLFLGVASTATSVGITARLLTDRRRLDTPEGVTTLAGAVVDDILGIITLTMVLALSAAMEPTGIAWGRVWSITAKALAIWLTATGLGLLLARRISAILKRFRSRTTLCTMALGLALIVAGLFERVGLAMMIGAYVMGLTLSHTDLAHVIREKLEPLYSFMVPLFFGIMGMLVDWRGLGALPVIGFALAYTGLAVVAKIAGCGLPALLFGFNVRGALRIGVGMLPRGEVALIVAGVGLAAGALSPQVFAVAILMTVVTTLCAPPVLVLLFGDDTPGVRHPEPTEREETIRFPCANARQAEWIINGLRDTLHRDGFFVHLLEHGGGTVLALRGTTSIAFRRELSDVLFTCEPRETAIVKTAVLYVVRELRTALEAMRRPLDVHYLLRDVGSSTRPADIGRDLRPFLRPDLVRLRLKATTRDEVLKELVGMVDAAGLVLDAKEVLAAVSAREQSMSTGLERGIAVPHCRTDAVDRLVCAIGIKPEGIDFGALDGQPSRVFVLTLSPASDPAPHVQFMSQIVQALSPAACRRLLRAESTHEAIAALSARPDAEPPPTPEPAPSGQVVPHHAIRANAVREVVMVPRLTADTKEGAIDELLAALSAVYPLDDPLQIRRQVLQREHLMSTGLERGIAVPHCRTSGVDRVMCAVGLKPEGMDFGSQDGAPTQIVVLLLASTSMPTPYAQTLALLLQALGRIRRTDLFACTDAAALHDMIVNAVEGTVEPKG